MVTIQYTTTYDYNTKYITCLSEQADFTYDYDDTNCKELELYFGASAIKRK